MKKHVFTPFLLTLFAVIFWGANFNVSKLLLDSFSPFNLVTIRFACSFLCILPIVFLSETRQNVIDNLHQNKWVYLLLSLIGIIGYNGLLFEGVQKTSAINAALIMASNPPVTLFFAALLHNEKLNISQVVGALISLISVGVVITHGSWNEFIHLRFSLGDLLVMMANVCWALYNVLSKKYLQSNSPLITTASTMFISTVILMMMGGGTQIQAFQFLLHQTVVVYSALVYMIIFGTVCAYLCWNYGISKLGAGKTAIFFNLIPVVTTGIAFVMGQPIFLIQIIGGISVIFGVLLSTNTIQLPLIHRTKPTYI